MNAETSYVPQVGGDHYQADFQHWDLIDELDVPYLEATSTKYVTRWDRKGSTPKEQADDLGKAASYLEKALKRTRRARNWKTTGLARSLTRFYDANNLSGEKRAIIDLILLWGNAEACRIAADTLRDMERRVRAGLPAIVPQEGSK